MMTKISKVKVLTTFLYLFLLFSEIEAQCCLKFSSGSKKCLQCPENMRIYKGHCLFKIQNCKKYSGSVECSECQKGYTITSDGYCQKQIVNTLQDYKDKALDPKTSDNILIVDDYIRSAHPIVVKAKITGAYEREFTNGTKYHIIQYQTNDKKLYEGAAEFYVDVPFLFQVKYFSQVEEIVKEGDNTPKQQQNPKNEEQENIQNQENGVQSQEFGQAGLNYDYMTRKNREKDPGFAAVDSLVRTINSAELGEKAIVLAVYTRRQGFSIEYIIFYESSDKKSIYENKSIYSALKQRVYIMQWTQSYLRQ